MKKFCELKGIVKIYEVSYNHQNQGTVEVLNKTV